MDSQVRNHTLWQTLPPIGLFVSEWQFWQQEKEWPHYHLAQIPGNSSELLPYAIDLSPLLALPFCTVDEVGVPYHMANNKYPAAYQPTTIAQYAPAQWNAYLISRDEKHRQAFMIQAHWLVQNESRFADDVGVWLMPYPLPDYYASTQCLSALTQGNALSVLVRACQPVASLDNYIVSRTAEQHHHLLSSKAFFCCGGLCSVPPFNALRY